MRELSEKNPTLSTVMTAVLAALAVAMFGVVPAAQAADPIKVGVYLPLTGQNAFGGQLELDGVQLAHKANPQVLGRPVELVIVDNKSDKVEAANAVTRLIERDKVSVVIGTYGSSLAMAGGEVAERAGVPVLGTSCTNPLVTEGKKYYFRACFIDPYQGAAAATYACRNLGFKKAAILMDVVSDYSVGLCNFFKRSFVKLGGEIVADLKYSSGDQDFTAQLTEIINKKPDVVFMPAYFAEGAIIMKQARELGGTFVIMGADAMDNPDTLTIGGKAVDGFLHTTFPYDPSMPGMSPEAKAFTEAWRAAYPSKDPNVNSALGYNCYNIIIDAITRAGSDNPEAITKALAETKNLPTALGLLTMNETHDAELPVGIIQYKDNKRAYLGEVSPEM
jgi:branched-chain amino acid transport system substrate-binding protein